MAIKYIMTEFDFDHQVRGWRYPKMFLTLEEAEATARRKWELEQNKYVLESWPEAENGYEYRNWFEDDGKGHIKACSCEYDNPFPRFIIVEPTDRDIVVFRAHEDEGDMNVKMVFMVNSPSYVYAEILNHMSYEISQSKLKSPVVKLNEHSAYLYDENCTNENYYQIINVRKY